MTQGNIYEEFAKLVSDPKTLALLRKRAEMDEFKTRYHAVRASPLKCPACSSAGYSGGSLWVTETKNQFVCRRCKLEWELNCLTVSTDELIFKMRQIEKED